MGDKANLALRYLGEHFHVTGVARTEAFAALRTATHLDAAQATRLLWATYHPERLWYLFSGIGVAAAIGTYFYAMWARRFEAPDI
jgi:hypothetical protein